jgi:2-aminoethylphosphonate transport system permease protein
VLALPSFLITLAFTFLYGSAGVLQALVHAVGGPGAQLPPILTSPLGVILAEITFFTPFVVRPLLASFAMLQREQLEVAASLGAGPLRVLRTVVAPEALPGLAAGGSLVLLLTLNEFGIVLFTGAKDVITLPVLIYTRGVVSLDLPGAAVVATAQVVLSLLLYGVYRFGFARLHGDGRDEQPTDPMEGAGHVAVVAHQ